MLISSIGLFIYPLYNHFVYYILCEVILGSAFLSEAAEALFYNCLKNENQEKNILNLWEQLNNMGFITNNRFVSICFTF